MQNLKNYGGGVHGNMGIGDRRIPGTVYTGLPHETFSSAWLVNLNSFAPQQGISLQNLAINCQEYPGHPYCDKWRNAQETSLMNLKAHFGAVNCQEYPGHPYCDGWRNGQEASLLNLNLY